MREQKLMAPRSVLAILRMFGLEMNAKTGGQAFDNLDFKELLTSNGYNLMKETQGDDVLILAPDLFLKTLQRTETTLNIKLFT